MAASCEDLSRPSLEIFQLCVQSICPMFNVSSLQESQFQALYSFICGDEVFVNLPTGYGKSLIFQMAPLVHSWMNEHLSAIYWKKNPIIIVISPLLALMQDQVKKLSSLGFKAAFVGPEQEPAVLQDIEQGKVTFVYISPESTLATERWRNMLESKMYQDSLIGIAVDEVHCVTEWGTSSSNKNRSAFRVWYSRLNEIKSLVDVPFIALTATATHKTKENFFDLLEFAPKVISESPNKLNVRYTVQKLDNSLPILENFRCLVDELKLKGICSTRTIIYCQTVKHCAHLFRMFELELGACMYDGETNPRNRLVDMLHSGSPESVKNHVLDQFGDNTKCLRILIATIAYGMGVNCKGVRCVIHFGPSKSIEAYMQESGRCGRDGEQSDALLFYNAINVRTADADMKSYIKSSTCRRQLLIKHFGLQHVESPSGHLCCDICADSCQCQGGHCDMDLYLPVKTTDEETQVRTISSEQMSSLKTELDALKKEIVMEGIAADDQQNALKLACHTKLLQFGPDQVRQIIDNAESIFSISSVMRYVDVWLRKHAASVLKIFKAIFNDVEEPMCDSDSEDDYFDKSTDEWVEMVNDQSFMELLNQSEWDVDTVMFDNESIDNGHDDEPAYPEFLDSIIGNINIE